MIEEEAKVLKQKETQLFQIQKVLKMSVQIKEDQKEAKALQ